MPIGYGTDPGVCAYHLAHVLSPFSAAEFLLVYLPASLKPFSSSTINRLVPWLLSELLLFSEEGLVGVQKNFFTIV
jgi:hypothetical protein